MKDINFIFIKLLFRAPFNKIIFSKDYPQKPALAFEGNAINIHFFI